MRSKGAGEARGNGFDPRIELIEHGEAPVIGGTQGLRMVAGAVAKQQFAIARVEL